MVGQCFIKLTTADKEKLKALAPVENDDLEHDDGAVATIVDDSDDEQVAPASVFVAPVAPKVEVPAPVKEEVLEPVKKKIIRKKTDA